MSPEWLDGYISALADAIAAVDSVGGASYSNFSAPVLLRLKAKLIELQAGYTPPGRLAA